MKQRRVTEQHLLVGSSYTRSSAEYDRVHLVFGVVETPNSLYPLERGVSQEERTDGLPAFPGCRLDPVGTMKVLS